LSHIRNRKVYCLFSAIFNFRTDTDSRRIKSYKDLKIADKIAHFLGIYAKFFAQFEKMKKNFKS